MNVVEPRHFDHMLRSRFLVVRVGRKAPAKPHEDHAFGRYRKAVDLTHSAKDRVGERECHDVLSLSSRGDLLS
jgi:hypothetical protein